MSRLANVLLISADHSSADAMVRRLAGCGYVMFIATSARDGLAHARAEQPDLILVGQHGDDRVALGAQLKADPNTAHIPVVVLAGRETADLSRRAYEAGLDDIVSSSCSDAELFARLRPLVRLATMRAELRLRGIVAREFGIASHDRARGQDERPAAVLVSESEAGHLAGLLANEADIISCPDLFEAEGLLGQRNFDAAVVSVTSGSTNALAFCSEVRANPRLFNLPIVLAGDVPVADGYRHGASRVLPAAAEPEMLRTAVATLVRRQRQRWHIRSALAETLAPATQDAATGTYSRSFLETYLGRRLNVARKQDRALAVVMFQVSNIEGVRRQFGDEAARNLARQVGHWIGGLLRAEDLTAFIGHDEFCAVLPDTPMAEAEVVMQRIAGVLAYTDFAVPEVYQPVKVWVQVHGTEAQHGDDVDDLLERARENLT